MLTTYVNDVHVIFVIFLSYNMFPSQNPYIYLLLFVAYLLSILIELKMFYFSLAIESDSKLYKKIETARVCYESEFILRTVIQDDSCTSYSFFLRTTLEFSLSIACTVLNQVIIT